MKPEIKHIGLKFPHNIRFVGGRMLKDIKIVNVQAEVYKDLLAFHESGDKELGGYDITHIPTGFKIMNTRTKKAAREVIALILKTMTDEELSHTDSDDWVKNHYYSFKKLSSLVCEELIRLKGTR